MDWTILATSISTYQNDKQQKSDIEGLPELFDSTR